MKKNTRGGEAAGVSESSQSTGAVGSTLKKITDVVTGEQRNLNP